MKFGGWEPKEVQSINLFLLLLYHALYPSRNPFYKRYNAYRTSFFYMSVQATEIIRPGSQWRATKKAPAVAPHRMTGQQSSVMIFFFFFYIYYILYFIFYTYVRAQSPLVRREFDSERKRCVCSTRMRICVRAECLFSA